ncbi:MAG: response regulator transcription factor [Eubacteriales bacterium]|nr:response regulator transcription factor [Eubacteriales bacterium]
MSKIRVMITDDHAMIREGLKKVLELEGDIEVIAQSGNGQDAIEYCKKHEDNIDILLLDVNMPKMNGIQTLEKLEKEVPSIKTIVLTIHDEVEYLRKAMELGAKGYVLKDSESDALASAIRSVYNGAVYIQPTMAIHLLNDMNPKTSVGKKSFLTKREVQVLKLVTNGMLNKEIAIRLRISEKTVKNHVSNIFKKIDVSDRTQAAVYAIKTGLVELSEMENK